ncbi:MAG: hypothetical protein OXR73_19715 [Myxococcales bacterium]|nr:hypothetical protein [Myxococcales bacterium]
MPMLRDTLDWTMQLDIARGALGVGLVLLVVAVGTGCARSTPSAINGSHGTDPGPDGGDNHDAALSPPGGSDARDSMTFLQGQASASGKPPPESLNGSGPCLTDLDSVLAEHGVTFPVRISCGCHGEQNVGPGTLSCLLDAADMGQAAELAIRCNAGAHWAVPETTFVALPTGERFAFSLTSLVQLWTDEQGERYDFKNDVLLERCAAFELIPSEQHVPGEPASVGRMFCVDAEALFRCSSVTPERPTQRHPPERPHVRVDVPLADGAQAVPLHLFVSNQSRALPTVKLLVAVNDTLVVRGDFDFSDGDSWLPFELRVPAGTARMRAFRLDTTPSTRTTLDISVPAERWALLRSYTPAESPVGEAFALQVSDTPITPD